MDECTKEKEIIGATASVDKIQDAKSKLLRIYALDAFDDPVDVETIQADVGIDIGGTLIGMHLRSVAVPVRISLDYIGEAIVLCAGTRPKYIGEPRAVY